MATITQTKPVGFGYGNKTNYNATAYANHIWFDPTNKQILLNGIEYIPKKLSELVNDSGFLTSITKSMVEGVLTGNITSHTHSYLPLSGGTMSNTNLVTNLNADLLDGYHASSFGRTNLIDLPYGKVLRIYMGAVRGYLINIQGTNSGRNAMYFITGYGDGTVIRNNIRVIKGGTYNVYFNGTSETGCAYIVNNGKYTDADIIYINPFGYDDVAYTIVSSVPSDAVLVSSSDSNILATLGSNVASASKWANARTITLTGSVTGSVSIDGSANVSLATTTNHTHTFASITSKPTTLSGYGITDAMHFETYDAWSYVNASFSKSSLAQKAANSYIEFWQSSSSWFNLKAGKFITAGGTSAQFLKGDGSLDSNTYALASDLGKYLPLTGGTLSGDITFSAANKNIGTSSVPLSVLWTKGVSSPTTLIIGAGTSVMTFDKDGNVAIGKSSVSKYKLDVSGSIYSMSGGITSADGFIKLGSSDSYVLLAGGGTKAVSAFATTSVATASANGLMSSDMFNTEKVSSISVRQGAVQFEEPIRNHNIYVTYNKDRALNSDAHTLGGDVQIKIPNATKDYDGSMSYTDKKKLDKMPNTVFGFRLDIDDASTVSIADQFGDYNIGYEDATLSDVNTIQTNNHYITLIAFDITNDELKNKLQNRFVKFGYSSKDSNLYQTMRLLQSNFDGTFLFIEYIHTEPQYNVSFDCIWELY